MNGRFNTLLIPGEKQVVRNKYKNPRNDDKKPPQEWGGSPYKKGNQLYVCSSY